ncbi:hypothetical protein RHMOL_Rhmol02G0054500 [Rhododendron molle]|uniref:Uncharacterized protein n=1 Tax=Rhododendron molle TaxID=49168 RepID=A0ACC0PNB5_RHOML|nr:hypothetical protein RHMOL_Rhmol02G0054500 [Rhododendron molle]
MPSTSRRRRQKLSAVVKVNKAKDRISNIPKNLIGHILSFLPTKYAVRTGILSTKWKWMWTSISNLDFDDEINLHIDRHDDHRQMSFLKFINRVLLLLEGSNTLQTCVRYHGPRLPVFHSLTTLELGFNKGANWGLLPNLLECSPNLRTLDFEGLMDDYYFCDHFWEWYPPERVPTCLLFTLEKINIGMFRGQENEVKVVEYFLANAKVLKIMDIRFDPEEMRLGQPDYQDLRKLLEMPRGSTSCKVMVG